MRRIIPRLQAWAGHPGSQVLEGIGNNSAIEVWTKPLGKSLFDSGFSTIPAGLGHSCAVRVHAERVFSR